MARKGLSIILFLMVLPLSAFADQGAHILKIQTLFWLDTEAAAQLNPPLRAPFMPLVRPDFGRQTGALWVRLEVENAGPPISRLLRIGPALLEQVSLWSPNAASHLHTEGGLRVPMTQRAVPDRETVFPVTVHHGHNDFYLRIVSPSTLAPIIDLWQAEAWLKRARLADLGNALMTGALLMIIVISIAYTSWAKEWYWLYYAGAIGSYILSEACDDGFASLWLWPEHPLTTLAVLPAALASNLTLYILFFLHFIPLNILNRRWRLLWALPILVMACLAIVYIKGYRTGVPLLNGLVVTSAIALSILSLSAWRKGFSAGRWAPLGFGVVIIAILHRLGVRHDWWPDSQLADLWLLPLSGVTGSGILLLAQLDKLRTLQSAEKRYIADIAIERDKAEVANRAKSVLLARVSHDLRTPLQTMMSYLARVRCEPGPAPLFEYLSDIQTSSRNMLALIEELLQFSRGEEGRLELNAKPAYLHALVDEIAQQGHILAQQQRNQFQFELNLPVTVAILDSERLRSVLVNLLSNAARMTADGKIQFRVTGTAEREWVCLSFEVQDSGPGIASEDRERIFQPFEHGQTHRESTGLGLAIVKQLVELMDGELHIRSSPGAGATFALTLACRMADESDISVSPSGNLPLGYEGPVQTLLLVEDEEIRLEFMLDQLSGMGFDVIPARNPREALDSATDFTLSAAIVEQHLKVGDGWQILDGLKDMNPVMPVILLSSTPARPPINRKGSTRFDACLLKSTEINTLVNTLSQQLRLRWQYPPQPLPHQALISSSVEAPPAEERSQDPSLQGQSCPDAFCKAP